MKIVLFGKSKHRTRTNLYFQRAFIKQGHPTTWIKFRKIRSYVGKKNATWLCKKWLTFIQPDLLFLYTADISYDLLKWASKRMKIVLYYEDPINDTFPKMVKFGKLADLFYDTTRGDLEAFQKENISAHYIAGGCDPKGHYIEKNTEKFYQSDVAFIGRPNNLERVDLLKAISKECHLKIWGSGWDKNGLKTWKKDVYPAQYRKICSGAKIILGQNAVLRDLFFSNRIWYTMGCGGFFLTAYTPNMEEMFQPAQYLDWFQNKEECLEKIKYYLSHEEERIQIAKDGFEFVHREYSFEKMVHKIIQDVQKLED